MKKERWCGYLVLFPDTAIEDDKKAKKEFKKAMEKINKYLEGDNWDDEIKEAWENRENFIDIHDWQKEDRREIEKIIKDTNIYYRLELSLDCEACE